MKGLQYLILAFFASLSGYSQGADHMLNGGFENLDFSLPGVGYSIEYAAPWKNLIGSCDLLHPSTPTTPGYHPAFVGQGSARIGHWYEFCYGQTDANIVAGQTYEVSFWVRRNEFISAQHEFGMFITHDQDLITNYNRNDPRVVPQVKFLVVSADWVQVRHCFTAIHSGTHYLAFGGLGDADEPSAPVQFVYMDEVKVTDRTALSTDPVADVNLGTLFCKEDQITANGSATVNETNYQWEIYYMNPNQDEEYQIYAGGLQSGQSGQLDVTTIFSAIQHPQYALCYNVVLWANNATCGVMDHQYFCIDDPRFFFVTDNAPVCENTPMQLEVTGDNGWTYSWSSGQSGVGLKNVTVTPSAPSASYTVTATTPAGCTYSQTKTFTVHTANNQAPTMNGINGDINAYTYYVQAGQTVNFNSTIFNNSGETVTSTVLSFPGITVTTPPLNTNGGAVNFYWPTQYENAGEYNVVLNLQDNNACGNLTSTYTFHIVVVCKTCPICYDFENRTPDNDPLSPEYHMGQCILAGITEPVVIGSGNHVKFQAGESIDMGTFFDTDGGTYDAIIDPGTCIDECYDCCDNWSGFTVDDIGVFSYGMGAMFYMMRFDDDDPSNDYFEVTDVDHPFCAYGITGYEIWIYDPSQFEVFQASSTADECCSYQSPSPENPIPHASIYWDGYTTNWLGNKVRVPNAYYHYELTLYSCTGETYFTDGVIGVNKAPIVKSGTAPDLTDEQADEQAQKEYDAMVESVELSPNPATDRITITGVTEAGAEYQIYDEKGHMVTVRLKLDGSEIDVSKLSAGTYFCRIYSQKVYLSKKFVKQ